MCVIETRTYVYPNGQRYTADYPRLCRDSNGISPCQYLRREQTELPGEAMPALSTNAPSPSSQSFPPTPPNFVNVEYRQPATVERRASKKDKDGRRTIKPEVFIRIGSSKKRDKEKEKRYKRYSGESVGTSGDSDIVVIESPTSRGPQRVSFMPGPSVAPPPPPAPAAPPISSAFHGGPGQPVSYTAGNYNTTYAHPPPPPPPPPPRNPPAAPMGESPPSSPDPTRRRRRRNPVELHQANPLPSAPSAATPRDNGRRARRNSTASAPANDNEFMMRQDERARLRAENQRREQERRRIAEEARQAKLERERAEARDQARKEERERRRQKERDEEEARRAAQARADAQREASRFAERERQRKEAADRRREEDARRKADEDRRQAEEDRRKAEEARLRREQETAAANARAATRDAERAAAREKQRRSEEDARRRNERATFRERARALEETTEQMARERAAFRQRDSLEADLQDAAAEYEASREYWSPRAGMSSAATPRLRNETRQISGGTRDPGPSTALRHSVRHVAPGAINQAMPLARGRGETIHERGERVIAEARAEAAQARAQDRTRDIMDRFAGMTMEDDDSGDSGFGGLLHSARRRATSRGAHDGGYYSDYEGGKRRKRYF